MKYIGKVQGFALHRSTARGLRKDLEEFQNPLTQKPDDKLLQIAIAATFMSFEPFNKVKPFHLNDVFLQDLDIWDKSPGLPWRDEGYKTNGDIKRDPNAIRSIRPFWHMVKLGDDIRATDCLAYARSHTCSLNENKVRSVWEYPATITFGEAMFAVPLIEAYKKKGLISYGYETENDVIMETLFRFNKYPHFTEIGFKKFHKTVPAWMIEVAFIILLYNVNIGYYEGTGCTDARRMYRMWNFITDYFMKTTIRTANGLRFMKLSGIVRGSYFTQLVESICKHILVNWAYLRQVNHTPGDILVLGGRSLVGSNKNISLQKAEALFSQIGMHINFEKSHNE